MQRSIWNHAAWLSVSIAAWVGVGVLVGCADAADETTPAVAEGSAVAKASVKTVVTLKMAAADAEGWEETAGLQFVVDGTIDSGARIFDAPNFQHTLVVPSDGSAFLLALKAQDVLQLDAEAMVWTPEQLPVPDPALADNVGMFMNDEGIIQFDTDMGSYQIQPEPPLVGAMTLEKLRSAKADYALLADEFQPDAGVLAELAASSGAEVKVFFGTWCSYCKHWLPPFMKTVEDAGDQFSVEYFGVSEDMSEPADELSRFDISMTPSFVVFKDGKEIGRIEEEPLESMEADLLHILKK